MTLALINLPFTELAMLWLLLLMLVGLAALSFGGDWLTVGAATVSIKFKINPLVVGLTIVSMATSMPEMMTSLLAAKDSPGLALGNILGSNVANIGLILGVTALIAPLAVQSRLIRREVPILIGVTLLFTLMALGGYSRVEGIVMLGLTVLYLIYVVRSAKQGTDPFEDELTEEVESASKHSTGAGIGLVLLGGALLAVGADVLVGTSVEIAGRMGVSDTLIGLTIVALGTSLPELAASVSAARSGHTDICAGNIVGSNLFNILLIGGGVATIIPIPVETSLFQFEFPAVFALTVLLLWFFKSGHTVSRREGVILIFLYLSILSVSALKQLGYIF
ncbi:MAG: calcium/sodium antiporter [Opitutaceae bacterium]